jgi:hypothetical protein
VSIFLHFAIFGSDAFPQQKSADSHQREKTIAPEDLNLISKTAGPILSIETVDH